jgi:hypothetical protein
MEEAGVNGGILRKIDDSPVCEQGCTHQGLKPSVLLGILQHG